MLKQPKSGNKRIDRWQQQTREHPSMLVINPRVSALPLTYS